MKNRTILFIGLGSIGKKHAAIINQNYPEINLVAYRSGQTDSNDLDYVKNYHHFDLMFQENNIDTAFITNPTVHHTEYAIKCAEKGIDLFIEKPISHSLENLPELIRLVHEKQLITYIGYDLRFNSVVKEIKALLDQNKRDSDPFYCRIITSSYLPNWRKERDYRQIYSARKD